MSWSLVLQGDVKEFSMEIEKLDYNFPYKLDEINYFNIDVKNGFYG